MRHDTLRYMKYSCIYCERELTDTNRSGKTNMCKLCSACKSRIRYHQNDVYRLNKNKRANKSPYNKNSYFNLRKKIEEVKKEHISFGLGFVRRYGFSLSVDVFNRYKVCDSCGTDRCLTFHHINGMGRGFANRGGKMDNRIENLRLLCRKCHGGIDGCKRAGKRVTSIESILKVKELKQKGFSQSAIKNILNLPQYIVWYWYQDRNTPTF